MRAERQTNNSLNPEDVLPDTRMINSDDLVNIYLDGLGERLLTAEEEIALAKQIEIGVEAQKELAQKDSLPSSKREELSQQIKKAQEAREQMIEANRRWVVSIAKKYVGRGLPFLDLIQEGNLGLMKAVEKYEWRKGYRFSTYATWWIRQSIQRAIANQARTIRLPVHALGAIRRLIKEGEKFEQEKGRPPTAKELAEITGIDSVKVESLLKAAVLPLSLSRPIGEEEESILADFISVPTTDPEDEAEKRLLNQRIREVLAEFPYREAEVIILRFGLFGGRPWTLEEVGKRFGVTKERIRQIERRAIKRLKSYPSRHKLEEFL